jgi:hypothetical protein
VSGVSNKRSQHCEAPPSEACPPYLPASPGKIKMAPKIPLFWSLFRDQISASFLHVIFHLFHDCGSPLGLHFGTFFDHFGIIYSCLNSASFFIDFGVILGIIFDVFLMTFLIRALIWPNHVLRVQFYRFTTFYMSEKHDFS